MGSGCEESATSVRISKAIEEHRNSILIDVQYLVIRLGEVVG